MFKKKMVNRVICLALSLTFIYGQVFAAQASYGASCDTMSLSSALDPDINTPRSDGFIKEVKPGQIGNGKTMLAIAKATSIKDLPPRLTLEDSEIAKLRDAIKFAIITLTAKDSQPEYREIVKTIIYNLVDLDQKLKNKTYLYNLIAKDSEDYSAGFGFVMGFTGLTKELIRRLPLDLLAQYVSHEVTPEDKVLLAEIKNEKILKKIGSDKRRAHRLVYNEILGQFFGKEAVESLGKEIRAAINEKLLLLAEAESGKTHASSAETFAEFVEMAKKEAKALKIEAEGLGRVFVVEVSGSNPSKAAIEIGASVGATRTITAEEGAIDFNKLISDLKESRFGLVIVAKGAKIKMDETNKELFEAAFKKDEVAKAVYEMALKESADKEGYLTFKEYGTIVTAILTAALGKKEIGIIVSQAGDIDYDTTVIEESKGKAVDTFEPDRKKFAKANTALFPELKVKLATFVSDLDIFAPLAPDTIRIGAFFGGGFASGQNNLLFETVKEADLKSQELGKKIEIVAIYNGWDGLIKEDLVNQVRPLILEEVQKYARQGGGILGTSRTNPYDAKNVEKGIPQIIAANIKRLHLQGLMTLGGDDTNGATAKLQKQFPDLWFMGLPKTMDNDVPLPERAPTYGYDTFVRAGAERAIAYKEIAQEREEVVVFESFGRKSGLAALGVGAGAETTLTLVREEGVLDFDQIAEKIKEFFKNNKYAAICVAEGIRITKKGNEELFEQAFKLDPLARAAYESIEKQGDKGLDEYRNPKLKGAARIVAAILRAKLQAEGIVVEKVGNLDYGPRSADTSEADLQMTSKLGKAAIDKMLEGRRDILLYVAKDGSVGEMSLQGKLGGRRADIEWGGANYKEYLAANQASPLKPAPAQDVASTTVYSDIQSLRRSLDGIVKFKNDEIGLVKGKEEALREIMPRLVYNAANNPNKDVKLSVCWTIIELAPYMDVIPSSAQTLYEKVMEAGGKAINKINVRMLQGDSVQAINEAWEEANTDGIYEVAGSEFGYIFDGIVIEHSAVAIGTAIAKGYRGPMFFSGDHCQVDKKKYAVDPKAALAATEAKIRAEVLAKHYSIDIDTSNLAQPVAENFKDLAPDEKADMAYKAQENNYKEAVRLTIFTRLLESIFGLKEKNIKIALNGEVGEVGTGYIHLEELEQFLKGYEKTLQKFNSLSHSKKLNWIDNEYSFFGFSKEEKDMAEREIGNIDGFVGMSVGVGTAHGGKKQKGKPWYRVSKEVVDLELVKKSHETLKAHNLIGPIVHGASSLPNAEIAKLAGAGATAAHLATYLHDIVWNHPDFPTDVVKKLFKLIRETEEDLYNKAVEVVDAEETKKTGQEQYKKVTLGTIIEGVEKSISAKEKLTDEQRAQVAWIAYEARGKGTKKIRAFIDLKKDMWDMPEAIRAKLRETVKKQVSLYVKLLNSGGIKDLIKSKEFPVPPQSPMPGALKDHLALESATVRPVNSTIAITGTEATDAKSAEAVPNEGELRFRAEVFKANLINVLKENREQTFFIGVETDIGNGQKRELMPVYKAINEIEGMKDSSGNKLFPKLTVKRASAKELVAMAGLLNDRGLLSLGNAFMVARRASVDNKEYDAIAGEGKAWIAAIDDSRPDDYLPVFEAINLNLMAYLSPKVELAAIKNLYDAIADEPIDPGVLQDYIRQRVIYILPRATKLDPNQRKALYELVAQVYIMA